MIIALLIIVALSNLLVAFFLFALWRAVIGKSSVDLKLSTSVSIQGKKMDALSKNLGDYNTTQEALHSTLKEGFTMVKNLINEKKS